MSEPMSTPDSGGLREVLGLAEHQVALRDVWRDLAEKNIEMGTDWPFIARVLFHDIDRLLAAQPEPVPTPDSADDDTVGEQIPTHQRCCPPGVCLDPDDCTPPADNTPPTALYESDDQIERALCAKRTPPCGIVGKHRHGDAPGVFIGQPNHTPPPAAGDVQTIRVMVTVDTDELREWAGKHADAGHHGVAHVLYKAASDGESLSDQTIAQAKDEERAAWSSWLDHWLSAVGPTSPTVEAVADWLRGDQRPFGIARGDS